MMKKYLYPLLMLLFVFNTEFEAQQITQVLKGTDHNAYTRIGPPEVFLYRFQLGKIATSSFYC